MEVSPCREYGPDAIVDMIVFQLVRSPAAPPASERRVNVRNAPVVDVGVVDEKVVARFCSQSAPLISWDSCELMFKPL